MSEAADAVQAYLAYLSDPEGVVDESEVADLTGQVDAASDPLQRVQLRARLHQLQNPDVSGYEGAFVEQAKTYAGELDLAEEHVIEALRDEGVPSDVLERAFPAAGSSSTTSRRTSGKRQSQDEVKEIARSYADVFTIPQLMDNPDVTASAGTVRKAVAAMVESGTLTDVGEVETTSQGAAPTGYKVA